MRAFHFRLQTKLDISCRQEQMAREEMQLRLGECQQIEEKLEQMILRLEELEQSIRDNINETNSFQTILIKKDFFSVFKVRMKAMEEKLKQAEEILEEARKILMEKAREKKSLEKLKEKEWHLYLHELQLEEQKIIDEMAINNHFRNNMAVT